MRKALGVAGTKPKGAAAYQSIGKQGALCIFSVWGGGGLKRLPGVSMTLKKWGHYPKLRGHGPTFQGSWRL